MTLLVLEQYVQLELAVAGTLGYAASLERLEGFGDKPMSHRVFQAQGVSFRYIFDIFLAQVLVHCLGELLRRGLSRAPVCKLIIEVVCGDVQVREAYEEASFHSGLLFSLVHRIDELTLVELFSGDGHDAVYLLDEMDGGGVPELRTRLDEVIHIVAVQAGERGHVRDVALAVDELVYLQVLRICTVHFLLGDELIVMEVRKEDGVQRVVENEAETALGREVAEFLMEHSLGEGVLELVEIDSGVSALPGVQQLHIRPVVLGKHLVSVFRLESAKLRSPFRVRLHAGFQLLPDGGVELNLVRNRTVLDISHILVIEAVHIILQLYDGGRVRGDDEGDVLLDAHTHQNIIAGVVVRDGIDALWVRIQSLHEAWTVALGDTRHGSEYGPVRRIALDHLAHDGKNLPSEDVRAVLYEVEEPDLRHLAVNGLQITLGDRDPFGLGGGSGGGGVKDRLAREEDVALAVLVSFHIRTEILVIVQFDVLLPQTEELFVISGAENLGEMVFLPIDGVLGIFQNLTKGVGSGFARLFAGFLELEILYASGQAKQSVGDEFVFSTHLSYFFMRSAGFSAFRRFGSSHKYNQKEGYSYFSAASYVFSDDEKAKL